MSNAALPERLHCGNVIFGTGAAERVMRKTVLIAFAILGGCMGQGGIRPLRPLEIPTAPYQEVVTSALVGSLSYEGGCLLFHDEVRHSWLLPVWPIGTTFNGSAVFFHEPAKMDQRLVVAEEFVMEGQPLPWTTLGGASYQRFQRQCRAQPFFVGNIRPAN